jgi:hypothetical protein
MKTQHQTQCPCSECAAARPAITEALSKGLLSTTAIRNSLRYLRPSAQQQLAFAAASSQ